MANTKHRLEGRTGEIWQMYLKCHTQEAIAEHFNMSQSNVSRILAEVRASIPQASKEEIVQKRVELLDLVATRLAEAAMDGDPAAVTALLKVQEREAKLLGLDSAIKQEVDATVRYEIAGIDEGDV